MPGLGSLSKGMRNQAAHSSPWIASVNWRIAAAKTPDRGAMVASSYGGTGGCSGLDARSSGPEQTLAPASGATGILGKHDPEKSLTFRDHVHFPNRDHSLLFPSPSSGREGWGSFFLRLRVLPRDESQSLLSLPVFGEGKVGLFLAFSSSSSGGASQQPHPALPEDGEGDRAAPITAVAVFTPRRAAARRP